MFFIYILTYAPPSSLFQRVGLDTATLWEAICLQSNQGHLVSIVYITMCM